MANPVKRAAEFVKDSTGLIVSASVLVGAVKSLWGLFRRKPKHPKKDDNKAGN